MKRRKGLAFILALSLVLSSFSVAFATDVAEETTPVTETTTEAVAPVATATNTAFADIAGHWAKDAIVKWADYGVVKGSDGVFRPDAPLTRAEMATVLSNLMDYKVAAKNNFSDVATGAWYADAVLKANAAGVLSGDGSGLASPSANITREQATSMLARAFAVADANGTSSSLTDTQNISSWARPAVFGMEAAGYVRGFEGKFNPKNNITRAEVMTIINNAVKAYYTAAGTYTENVDGLAVVKVPGVVLKDVVISGNLIAAEGIASGDLTLDGKTEVKGKLIVRGGGENSIIIKGSAAVLSIEVSKVDGKVRIFADVALIKEITALKGEIILEGNFTNVEVKADATVIIKGNVGTLSMESKGTVDIQSGTVTTLDIPAGATATIAANATVTTANITGAADIKGTGAIGTANISGTGATIVQTPTAVNIADGGAATVGGKTVDGATSAAPSTGGGSGGGGNSSNTVAVSAININKSTTTLVEGTTETLTVTFTPSNASNKTITWTTSDASKATIDSTGKVRAVSAGTATITAKSNNGKTATCVVTVTTTVVSVSAISVSPETLTLTAGGATGTLTATVSPAGATNKNVTWASSNTSVATVAGGVVTPVAAGTTTITATTVDGGFSKTVDVTVNPAPVTLVSIAITTPATKLAYNVGETLDIAGLVVTGTYSNSSTKAETITTANVSGFNSSTVAASQTLTVTVNGKMTSYVISIVKKAGPILTGVTADNVTNKVTGMAATMEFSTDGITWVKYNETTPNLPDLTGDVDLQVRFASTATHEAGAATTFNFTAATLESIAVKTSATKLVYKAGEALDITGLVIEGTYSDESKKDVAITAANVSGFDSTTVVASQTLTVTVDGKTTTYTVEIKAATLESIAIKTPATKLVYKVGETLDITGLVIEGTYSNGSKKNETITAANVTGFDSSAVVESQTLTVTVDGKTTTYTVEIKAATLVSIAVKTPATKLVYTLGETLDITGLVIEGTYSDASKKDETITSSNVTGFNSSAVVVSQTLTVTVDGKTTTYTVEIKPAATLSSIAVKMPATKLVYAVGETLDITGLVIEGTYSDSSKRIITITSSNVSGFNSSAVVASQALTVTVDGKTTTYTVEIQAVSVTGVSLNQTAMDLKVGTGTGTLTATIAPANATNKTVTWESSVPTIATVDSNGKVTPVATGTTTITVTTADGSKTATCTVTVTAANIANAVLVGGNGEANTLKSDFPYWVNGARSKTGTLGSEGCTAFFDHLTGILTLHGYNGGEIKSSFASEPDLIIKLIGTNKVTTLSQVGIENGYSGNIYITAENDASLEINSDSTENSYGIATGHISGNSAGSVVIGGKAKVTIDAETTGTSNTAIGISAKNDVTIHENADLTIITKTAGFFDNEGIFAGNNITINTTKNIAIDLSTNTKGLVLSRSTIINNVNLMTLKAPTDGEFIFGTPDLSGVAVNIAGKVASYRSGTPYTLKVKNGEITGVAAGVIVQAGQPYQALANDTITIKSKIIPLFKFVKWMDAEGNDLDASLFTGGTTASSPEATIKMPAKDLNIKAEYKSILFVTQPSFHRGDAKVTWEISQAANGYLQKKNVGVWEGFGTSITSDIGVGNKVISSSQQPDGTYRLKFVFGTGFEDFDNHYSNEFEILWDAQLAGTVTISGTPKYGETLTANVTGTQPDAGDLKYQWFADSTEISGATEKTLVLGADQVGKQIKVKVSSHNYNMPIESAPTAAVAKADGPGAIDSYTGTSEVEANIKLAGLGASTPNLEVAVAIDGSAYDEYRDLSVYGDGKASILGLTGVNASTKVKVRIKESPTHFAGADREITVTVAADTTPPVITASDKILPIANLADWTETVWATDDVDGSISGNVVATYFQSDGTTSLTDLAAAKTYIDDASVNTSFVIKYNVKDAAGNAATEVVVTITVTEANVPDSIQVGSSILNSTNPYLVDGTPATTGTLGAGNCTAHFDPITGVLSLQDYVGGKIHINEAGKDLSIKLIGNANKITGGQFGIHNDKGDIYITSDNEALLEIEINSSFDGAAIANGWMTMTENPSVFIGGEVKLTIKAEYTGEQTTNSITGIYAGRGSVIIQDQADYSATLTNPKYQGRGIYSSQKTIINTSGKIEIDVSDSDQGIGIHGYGGIDINKVNSMLITIPSTGGTNTKFTSGTVDVSSGVAVNKSATKASYRSGTPYALEIVDGDITSATGDVIGSPHQYLEGDEITIESTATDFDRWTKANGAPLETTLFINTTTKNSATATIKMLAGSLSIKAREKEFGTEIDIVAIPGVTAPVTGATPVTTITATAQYTGTVTWSPKATKFAGDTVYTATITLVAKPGYKLDGVDANFFTVAGATVTNEADTGEIIAVFPATAADTLIDIAEIPGVVAPVTGKTPVTTITETDQYTGTVAWTPADNPFAAKTVYTATIKLTAKPGFTLTGVAPNFFTVNGIATTHVAGVVTVEFPATEASDFAAGSGTVGDPYQVSSAEELNKVRNHLDKHFKQTANIDLSTYTADGGWQPIGDSITPFIGKYNGNNFKISNLTINRPDANAQGLFGYITYGSVLENISLTTVNVKGKSYVGGLVGYFINGTITSCNVVGTVNGKDYVGGLVGRQSFGTITSSYTLGTVNGTDIVGGLVGSVDSGSDVKVTNSYSLASVKATESNGRVGGLVGLTWKAIINCYAAGQVTGNGTNAGGLIGKLMGDSATITLSYYDIETTGQTDTGKGVGKTTAEMKQAATFTGWDTSIWNIIDGSYPKLK